MTSIKVLLMMPHFWFLFSGTEKFQLQSVAHLLLRFVFSGTKLPTVVMQDARFATYRLCCDKDLMASKELEIDLHNSDSICVRRQETTNSGRASNDEVPRLKRLSRTTKLKCL